MTIRDVTSQYKKSKLGVFWSIGEPVAIMAVLYLVFGVGLKGGRNMSIPYICYLVSGITVLNFFQEVFTKGTIAVQSHNYLINKIHFRLSILPIVVVLTGIVNHLLFFIAAIVIFIINGLYPNIYWIQLIYYIASLSIFMLGMTWFTSSVGLFFPDLKSVVLILNRMLFYFSPILWQFDDLPDKLKKIVIYNPLFYIVTGYRNSLFNEKWFWEDPFLTIYFWGITLFVLFFGIYFFRKLRPQFADFV